MLQTLTAHLLKTRELHIPYVGSFRMVHHPAVLQFADRLLVPPHSEIIFEVAPDEVQSERSNASLAEQNTIDFGHHLKTSLSSAPFVWSGIGTLSLQNDRVLFEPEEPQVLLPVAAHKIIRENRQHAILVGDREQSSADTSFINESIEKRKTWLWVGWVLLLISLLVIGFIIYKDGALFGSKIKAGTAFISTLQQYFYS